jgi:hypothetical protein
MSRVVHAGKIAGMHTYANPDLDKERNHQQQERGSQILIEAHGKSAGLAVPYSFLTYVPIQCTKGVWPGQEFLTPPLCVIPW